MSKISVVSTVTTEITTRTHSFNTCTRLIVRTFPRTCRDKGTICERAVPRRILRLRVLFRNFRKSFDFDYWIWSTDLSIESCCLSNYEWVECALQQIRLTLYIFGFFFLFFQLSVLFWYILKSIQLFYYSVEVVEVRASSIFFLSLFWKLFWKFHLLLSFYGTKKDLQYIVCHKIKLRNHAHE